MNNTSVKRILDGKKSDEPRAKLNKVLGKILGNFSHLEKCVEFSKDILAECSNKLEDLRSQIIELESVIEEINSSDQQQSPDARVQERSRLRTVSDQEIIEEITIEGSEKSGTKNPEDRRKRQRTNSEDEEISIIIQNKSDNCTPGPSKEQTMNDKEIMESTVDLSAEDVVQMALQKTKGVLSAQELNTFLYLSENVQDPVQLAKISFTTDIKMLYFQLMTFHFHLKVANDTAENLKGPSSTNRELENKVKHLVHTLQADI